MTDKRSGLSPGVIAGSLVFAILAVLVVYVVIANDDGGRRETWRPAAGGEPNLGGGGPDVRGSSGAGSHERSPSVAAVFGADAGVAAPRLDPRRVVPRLPPGQTRADLGPPPEPGAEAPRFEPVPPAALLERARSLQSLLERRQTELRADRERAVQEGDDDRVAQIDRTLERMTRQMPTIARRIEQLEQRAAEGPRE